MVLSDFDPGAVRLFRTRYRLDDCALHPAVGRRTLGVPDASTSAATPVFPDASDGPGRTRGTCGLRMLTFRSYETGERCRKRTVQRSSRPLEVIQGHGGCRGMVPLEVGHRSAASPARQWRRVGYRPAASDRASASLRSPVRRR